MNQTMNFDNFALYQAYKLDENKALEFNNFSIKLR